MLQRRFAKQANKLSFLVSGKQEFLHLFSALQSAEQGLGPRQSRPRLPDPVRFWGLHFSCKAWQEMLDVDGSQWKKASVHLMLYVCTFPDTFKGHSHRGWQLAASEHFPDNSTGFLKHHQLPDAADLPSWFA